MGEGGVSGKEGLRKRYMTGSYVGTATWVRGLGRGWSGEGVLKTNCRLAMWGEIKGGR